MAGERAAALDLVAAIVVRALRRIDEGRDAGADQEQHPQEQREAA